MGLFIYLRKPHIIFSFFVFVHPFKDLVKLVSLDIDYPSLNNGPLNASL